jgi:outer membrane protein TolC
MDIPLFNGFATRAQTEKAAASLNQQHADFNKASAQVLRDTQAAHRQLNSAAHLWNAYTQANHAATQQQLAIETAIKHKLATPLDLAKAKEKLTELKMKKMEYLLAANKAFLVLQELTGVLNIESALGRLSKLE